MIEDSPKSASPATAPLDRRGLAATFALALAVASPAHATDPAPGDAVTLPSNVNVVLLYNQLSVSGDFVTSQGKTLDHTRVVDDVTLLRYVRTFDLLGTVSGVQFYIPYVAFLGKQKVGGQYLPADNGFAQPNFSAFSWVVNQPRVNVVVAGWVSPPLSSFKTNGPPLQAANDTWFEQAEIGAHFTLTGSRASNNLALEAWTDTYFFQDNNHFATGTKFREQPSEELRFYLNYTFDPGHAGFASLGFLQSFGGKQTLAISGLPFAIDTGNRTNESQIRLAVSRFVGAATQLQGYSYIDVAAHGGPKQRVVGLRLAEIF